MPSSHLPRTPCDKFIYDFPSDFLGILGGYGLRRMCSHCLRASCDSPTGPRGQPGVNPYRDCAEIVRKSCNASAVVVQSPQPSHGNRMEPVRGSAFARPCGDCAMPPTTCLRATVLRFFFKFVKLLAETNRRGRGARESVRKSHSRLLPPQGGLAEAARKGGYGLRRPIAASQMWTRHYFCVTGPSRSRSWTCMHNKNCGVKITSPVLIEDHTMHFTPVLNLRW